MAWPKAWPAASCTDSLRVTDRVPHPWTFTKREHRKGAALKAVTRRFLWQPLVQ